MSAKQKISETVQVWLFGLRHVPLLLLTRPKVLELSEARCRVKLPLTYMSKNHLGSMYFGALAIGADCAGGLLATYFIRQEKQKISLVFKDFKAEFIKRAMHDVVFSCEDGAIVKDLVEECISSKERHHRPLNIVATCNGEVVAKFVLTLSLKVK